MTSAPSIPSSTSHHASTIAVCTTLVVPIFPTVAVRDAICFTAALCGVCRTLPLNGAGRAELLDGAAPTIPSLLRTSPCFAHQMTPSSHGRQSRSVSSGMTCRGRRWLPTHIPSLEWIACLSSVPSPLPFTHASRLCALPPRLRPFPARMCACGWRRLS